MDAGTVLLIILLGIVAVGGTTALILGTLLFRVGLLVARRTAPGAALMRRGVLQFRAQSGPQQRRELAGMRLRLRDSLAATGRSLGVAMDSRQHIGNLAYIVRTLEHAGSVVDRQLAVAERDPDRGIQRVYAQTLGVQVEQILQTASGVRQALARTSQPMTAVDISELTRRLDVEAKMLDNWAATYTALGRP